MALIQANCMNDDGPGSETVRLLELEDRTYDDLTTKLASKFGLNSTDFKIYFVDESGDKVLIANTEDLLLSFRVSDVPLKLSFTSTSETHDQLQAAEKNSFEFAETQIYRIFGFTFPSFELQNFCSIMSIPDRRVRKMLSGFDSADAAVLESADSSGLEEGEHDSSPQQDGQDATLKERGLLESVALDQSIVMAFQACGSSLGPRDIHALLRIFKVAPRHLHARGLVGLQVARQEYRYWDAIIGTTKTWQRTMRASRKIGKKQGRFPAAASVLAQRIGVEVSAGDLEKLFKVLKLEEERLRLVARGGWRQVYRQALHSAGVSSESENTRDGTASTSGSDVEPQAGSEEVGPRGPARSNEPRTPIGPQQVGDTASHQLYQPVNHPRTNTEPQRNIRNASNAEPRMVPDAAQAAVKVALTEANQGEGPVALALAAHGVVLPPPVVHVLLRFFQIRPRRFARLGLVDLEEARQDYRRWDQQVGSLQEWGSGGRGRGMRG
eukprot:CAMPEP_0113936856 /NCGR_PEP_ID=MMETSP1339-20121228/3625_1 /TAXON_ID=94617 /ORGANISM="Fibrocapsa japonica" /LENGTH=495 /DNA_ID=CAMNT_0000939423 /DNA_START=62 /DNA_END=1546 /DNA_ORIENTATION=+ /assembly_acc=CAM_ASM_000762